jgi:uncharacterized protein YndB with AHSA1/START domain
MSDLETIYVTYIRATPEQVWQGLTDGDFTRRYWVGRRISSDWRPGAPVQLMREDGVVEMRGEVLEADPPCRLSYTFHLIFNPAHEADAPSRLTFELEPMDEVVRLTLLHQEFGPGSVTYETTRHGWPALMASLKSLLETGEALPFAHLGFGPRKPQAG